MSLLSIDDLKSVSDLCHYTEDDIKTVLSEYNKTVQDLFDDVKIIKEWLKTQPHLPAHPGDRQIASFIVNNKFSIEKTKSKIDMSYTIRALVPEYYKFSYPKSQQFRDLFIRTLVVGIVPKLSNNSRILCVYYKKEFQDEADPDMVCATFVMFTELMTLIDFSKTFEYVCDFRNLSFGLCSQFTPTRCLKFAKILESVYSGRLKALHAINLPKVLTKVMELISGVITSKLQSKFHFHENIESLKKHYSEDVLPVDFGGKVKSIHELHQDSLKLLECYNDHFYKLTTLKVNEELRPEKLKNDEMLGFYGNFKKINID